jgi:proteic killer suppression protein
LSLYRNSDDFGLPDRGLKKLFERDDPRGLPPPYVDKIKRVLLALDTAGEYKVLDLPGFGLHPLTGGLAGFWSITISRNWRITFRFEVSIRPTLTSLTIIDWTAQNADEESSAPWFSGQV